MKTVVISATLKVMSEMDDEAIKAIFNLAIEILNEKFPFPDARILNLEISESWNNHQVNYRPLFSIRYGENGAKFETETSDSENDTSDSMEESDESSDSSDESDEDFDSIDESIEDSDTEDMNGQE